MKDDGTLGNAASVINDAGPIGPTRAASAPPGSFAFSGHDRTHAHMIQSDPSGQFVLHVDLGLDKIFVNRFDQSSGMLTPNDPPFVELPAGDGPRHFHFHPNGKWFYSVQEEGSTVAVYNYDATLGNAPTSSNHLHSPSWICWQQFLLGNSRVCRWSICLCRQSIIRLDRHLCWER